MQNSLIPAQVDLENIGPDVRAYIYQTLMEFDGFTTPETSVSVVARDPLKLIQSDAHQESNPEDLKKFWRIAIILSEDGTKIEEEGVHVDVYAAVRIAKEKLLKTLSEIQDNVVTTQDRIMQIRSATDGTQTH